MAIAKDTEAPLLPVADPFQLVKSGGEFIYTYIPERFAEKVFALGAAYQTLKISRAQAIGRTQAIANELWIELGVRESFEVLRFLRDEEGAETAATAGDFCLEMYRRMGLLDGIRVVRSSDPAVRTAACAITECFVDVPHQGEIVRARLLDGALKLHEGGESYTTLPRQDFTKTQVSPTRDSRLGWMQSVIHCTHYIAGMGEQAYLNKADAPDITFVTRETIDRSDEAYAEISRP